MYLRIISLLIILTTATLAQAQTLRLSGKVVNEKNEPLTGVSVKLSGSSAGTATDVEGRYSLSITEGTHTIEFSAVGYGQKQISDVTVKGGQLNELNVTLQPVSKDLGGIRVTATRSTASRETVNAAIQFQKNTNTVAQVVSAETIRRSPDRNTGEVLKRTPGASLQEGRFIVVRGLADRYNQAMVNGVLLSSTEADRKSFSFDLFPANMIDNIIINKAFVPELPGEWAGGLIQVNTRDIPTRNFLSIQAGTGFNTQTIGNDFYTYQGGKWDWLGFDDGTRELPSSYTSKSRFDALTPAQKTAIGTEFQNVWSPEIGSAPLNASFQASAGFNARFRDNKALGGILAITYSRNNRWQKSTNSGYAFPGGDVFTTDFSYTDDRYSQDVLLGALGNLTYQFNSNNKISWKNLFNINTTDYFTNRRGIELGNSAVFDSVRGYELAFKQNTFYNTQLTGEHNFTSTGLRFKWYGSFNILDSYIPDQRRLVYTRNSVDPNDPYRLLLSNTLSQRSGNRFYQFLNDYIYTAGGDLSYGFDAFGNKQTVKGGYLFQVKDRLFDAKPFSVYLPLDNPSLKLLSPDRVFAPQNFGNGDDNKFAFDAIKGSLYRYVANTILNAGYVQFDNQFSDLLRVVWGLRVEHYDQLVGSVKKSDPRHTYSKVIDYLPGVNLNFRVNSRNNIRVSASQTVVRPEFRELANFNYYDFDLNASVQGNPALERTKITNLDLRYELYPRAGEVLTAGVFYKKFDKPIEQVFNLGAGGASSFNFQNPDEATSYGVELELRRKLDFAEALKNITFLANASYIYSRVKDDDKSLNIDRPLQGQSNYLLNFGLLYDAPTPGLNITFLYNQIGKRIAFAGGQDYPDIWEGTRPILDLQMAKKLLKNKGEVRLNVSDILNRKLYFYQNTDGNTKLDRTSDALRFVRQYGTSVNISFGYNF
jgi:TonB-dependent receptor